MNETTAGINTPWGPLLETIVRGLVSKPDEVVFKVKRLPRAVLVEIRPNINDARKIIGKKGQAIQAAQLLFKVIGNRHDENIRLTVLEGKGERIEDTGFMPDENWNRDSELDELTTAIGNHLFEKEFDVKVLSHGVESHVTMSARYNPPLDPLLWDAIGKILKNFGGANGRSVHFHYKETN